MTIFIEFNYSPILSIDFSVCVYVRENEFLEYMDITNNLESNSGQNHVVNKILDISNIYFHGINFLCGQENKKLQTMSD